MAKIVDGRTQFCSIGNGSLRNRDRNLGQRTSIFWTFAFLLLGALCLGQETSASLRLVGDLNKGPSSAYGTSSSPSNLAVLDDRLCFIADDGVHGAEPWSWDGTPKGFQLLDEIFPGAAGISRQVSPGDQLYVSENRLILNAGAGNGPRCIYSEESRKFNPLTSDGIGLLRPYLYSVGDKMLVSATLQDGSVALNHMIIGVLNDDDSITRVLSFSSNGRAASFRFMQVADRQALLYMEYTQDSVNLSRTDGTTSGTFILKSFPNTQVAADYFPIGMLGDLRVYAILIYDASGVRRNFLVQTDGTVENTTVFPQDYPSFWTGERPQPSLDGPIIFSISTRTGTAIMFAEGDLSLMHPIISLPSDGSLYYARKFGDQYIFLTTSGVQAQSILWLTDGTSEGTHVIHDLGKAYPLASVAIWNGFYYYGLKPQSTSSYQLWRTDGTESGTKMVFQSMEVPVLTQMTVFQNMLVFGARLDAERGAELYALLPDGAHEDETSNTLQLLGVQSGASDFNSDCAVDSSDGQIVRFSIGGAK
ncbi:hypothetical protein BH09SUM1_BH09SUM1_20710 [soil metagenome]